MSRIFDQISICNSFAVLLDNSLKENQSLRECDKENAAKFQDLFNKVDSLCNLVAENNLSQG